MTPVMEVAGTPHLAGSLLPRPISNCQLTSKGRRDQSVSFLDTSDITQLAKTGSTQSDTTF